MLDLSHEEINNLLNRIAKGDDKAATTLYLHYHRGLFAFIRLRVPDDTDAENILNDTFMVAYRKPEGFNGESKFSTWLYGIAKNKALDWWRRKGRLAETVEMDDEQLALIPDAADGILDVLERKDKNEVLRECIEKLPLEQRDALYFSYYEDENVEFIAQQQQCPVGTVKTRLFNARIKIRTCMEKAWGK
jgi:RNA polymerase sigma-70 factor (ECF subfamily)